MNRSGTEPLRSLDPVRIGPYQLLGRLGEGGMGTVYLALTSAQRPVAIKVIKPEFTVDENFADRFHAEVANARRVASFCTAQVLDNGNTGDGRPYMVTEYISGLPLSRQISMFGALEPGPLTGVALGVAAALTAIHAAGLVHRDLKPSNVILSISGPRVIDFGISRALDASTSFTRSGELLGSPGWWAPEQVRGDVISPAVDIFAWGCLVAYAGTGRPPYGQGDALTLAARVLNGPPDLGALPMPLLDLARRATDADPQRRPSAQELLLALVGGAAGPMPARAEPATLVATEILNESWQAPVNVTNPADTIDTTDPVGWAAGLPAPATGAASYDQDDHVMIVDIEPTDGHTRAAATVPGPILDRSIPGRPVPGLPPRGRTWLIPVLAIIAALGLTVVIFVLVHPVAGTGSHEKAGQFVSVAEPPDGPGTDIGRHVTLGTPMVQAFVPQPPACGRSSFGGASATDDEAFCVIRLTMLNLGGVAAPVKATSMRLIDDHGEKHAPRQGSTDFPRSLEPGDKIDGTLVFELPRVRAAARLILPDGTEVRL